MAKIRAGILSKVSGKVAGVVGGTWKDVNYLREYVIPANPKTAGQVAQRNKFSDTVEFAKPLVGPIFNVYTDKFQKSMSGFNFFIKSNIAIFDGTPDYSLVKITEGKLTGAAPNSLAALNGNNNITFDTLTTLGSNGKADDKIFGAVYNESSKTWGFSPAVWDRSAGAGGNTITITTSVGQQLSLYIVAAQYIGTVLDIISISDYGTVTVSV